MNHRSKYATNPYIFMLQVCWRYAGKLRWQYLFIYTAFAFSNLAQAALPVLWGTYINDLQKNGTDALQRTWVYGLIYLAVKLTDWALHGPARILERKLAFFISKNFMEDYYHKVLRLPVKWQQDHHSGETINRVRKAYESVKGFVGVGQRSIGGS